MTGHVAADKDQKVEKLLLCSLISQEISRQIVLTSAEIYHLRFHQTPITASALSDKY